MIEHAGMHTSLEEEKQRERDVLRIHGLRLLVAVCVDAPLPSGSDQSAEIHSDLAAR